MDQGGEGQWILAHFVEAFEAASMCSEKESPDRLVMSATDAGLRAGLGLPHVFYLGSSENPFLSSFQHT